MLTINIFRTYYNEITNIVIFHLNIEFKTLKAKKKNVTINVLSIFLNSCTNQLINNIVLNIQTF